MSEIRYTKTHEWIKVEDSKGKIGVSRHAQEELGDVVYVELPEEGEKIQKGESFGVIESVKTASDLYAPCSGKVISKNQELSDKPQLVNEDALGKGWMIEIEIKDSSELEDLMDETEYKELI